MHNLVVVVEAVEQVVDVTVDQRRDQRRRVACEATAAIAIAIGTAGIGVGVGVGVGVGLLLVGGEADARGLEAARVGERGALDLPKARPVA